MHPTLRSVLIVALAAGSVVLPATAASQSDATAQLAAAKSAWERHPANADSIIWYGRRVGYTGDFARAIAIFNEGVRLHPRDARMLRHRGHRYISVRDFPRAIADLEAAYALVAGKPDQVEPDGQPNARGIPTSTLQSNIRYHLALAHFVSGDFVGALPVWAEDAAKAPNVDSRVASTFWWVLTLANLGRHADARAVLAPIRADWDVIENGSYHRALLWFKGEIPEAELLPSGASALERQTAGNGIGHWHANHGRQAQARAAWDAVLATGPSASFGYIAAEQAVARLTSR